MKNHFFCSFLHPAGKIVMNNYIIRKDLKKRIGEMMKYRRIDVYVPETHAEAVKQAMFDAGAGTLGNYDCCCFQTVGRGQFRPLPGADPYLGETNRVEHVTEWKLEMIFPEEKLPAVLAALRQAHPYETPAFQHWAVEIE